MYHYLRAEIHFHLWNFIGITNYFCFIFSTLLVTVEGKVYACGEATNGRLGLGISSGTVPIPRQITALSNYVVKKVAVHSGTACCYSYIYSWNVKPKNRNCFVVSSVLWCTRIFEFFFFLNYFFSKYRLLNSV